MSGKGFFRIDRRNWAAVCDLGMSPAAAYLVLACGTGGDNRTTAWSAQAVANYSGIAWKRGKPAIEDLCKQGFVKQTHTGIHPRYEILDRVDVLEARDAIRPKLSAYDADAYDQIVRGTQPRGKGQRAIAEKLVREGWLWSCSGHYRAERPPDCTPPSQHYIWLPQTLVMGTAAGEDSPLSRIRRTQDVMTLRLLVDLYHAQHLRDDGGINRAVVCQKWERERVGEQGIHVVWAFSRKHLSVRQHDITLPHWKEQADGELVFWKRLQQLREQGLIEFIPHLCESDSDAAELIHPYGLDWTEKGREMPENAVGEAANRAGLALAPPDYCRGFERYLAPVPRDYPDVQMVGVARLRYRPHTQLTSQWWSVLHERLPGFIKRYDELSDKDRLDIKGHQGVSSVVKGCPWVSTGEAVSGF